MPRQRTKRRLQVNRLEATMPLFDELPKYGDFPPEFGTFRATGEPMPGAAFRSSRAARRRRADAMPAGAAAPARQARTRPRR